MACKALIPYLVLAVFIGPFWLISSSTFVLGFGFSHILIVEIRIWCSKIVTFHIIKSRFMSYFMKHAYIYFYLVPHLKKKYVAF